MSRFVDLVIKDKDRKPLIQIGAEMVIGAIKEKEKPHYYLDNLLYKKGRKNFNRYLGRKNLAKIRSGLFHSIETPELDDKMLFSEIMENNNLPSPLTKRLSVDGKFYVQNKLLDLSKIEFKTLMNELVAKSNSKSIFLKPLDAIGGKNCYKIYKETVEDDDVMDVIFETLKKGEFIYQETIEQHPLINKIYPNSINTIRVYSNYNISENKVDILSALMRFGKDEMVVDNGGLFVSIDLDNWCLSGNGQSFFDKGGEVFEKHPNSSVTFDKYKLIYKDEIFKVIDKGARLFNGRLVGWDIALTPKGIMVIEVNNNPSLLMAQITCGGFKHHKGFMEIFEEYIN